MKKFLFTLVLIVAALSLSSLKAQVTIGSNVEPNANALLDLKETAAGTATKGLLLPRVALTSTASFSPLSGHVAGMTVYNTADVNDVTKGYYYNDGDKWVRLADAANVSSAWLLGGNTNGTERYIGTNDAYDFPIKVRNYEAMRVIWDADNSVPRVAVGAMAATTVASATSGSTAEMQKAKLTLGNGDASINGVTVGKGGGQIATNTALGTQSLYNNTTGAFNVGVGSASLNANTTGNYNVGVGNQSLVSNTTGGVNVGIGYKSLNNNTTGTMNIGVGSQTLITNVTGSRNIAIGDNALYNSTGNDNVAVGDKSGDNIIGGIANVGVGSSAITGITSGNYNTGVGYRALFTNQTGNYNVAIGKDALYWTTVGNNTAVGYEAGSNISSGASNVNVGYQAGDNITTGANNIAIGASTKMVSGTASNQMNIGNAIFGTGMTGTASAPAGNIGIDEENPGSTLTARGSFALDYKDVTASRTLGASDYYLSFSGTSDATFTLPAAAADGSMLGRMYSIKNVSAKALTITTSNSENLRNNQATFSSFVMFPGSYCLLANTGLTSGVTWNVVLLSQSTAFALSGKDDLVLSAATYNAGTPLVVPFAATDKQVDSGSPGTWNDAGDYFTVEQNGYYEIAAMVHFNAQGGFVAGGNTFQGVNVAVTKNGTTTNEIIGGARGNIPEDIAAVANTPIVVRFIAELQAGNVLRLVIYKGYGENVVTSVDIAKPIGTKESRYFNIKKI